MKSKPDKSRRGERIVTMLLQDVLPITGLLLVLALAMTSINSWVG